MKINSILKSLVFSVAATTAMTSCVKNDDWETPPIVCNNKFDAPTISMADFAALASGNNIYKVPVDGPPVIFDAYIVSSDEFGNFYKTISIQDKPENPTIGLSIEVDKASNYADFPVGAHVRIKANGLVVGMDRGTKKIGSVDPQYAIGRIPAVLFSRYMAGVCNGNGLDVAKLIPTKLNSLKEAKNTKYINTLVTVPDVQFSNDELEPVHKTFLDYDAGGAKVTNRAIESKAGGSTLLRNSDFTTFGSQLLPTKSGDLTFVVSAYAANNMVGDTSYQMYIRNLTDINFTKDRFSGSTNPGEGGVEATNLFFQGADFENWNTFLSSLNSFGLTSGLAVQSSGTGRDGSKSFNLNGTPSANTFLFTVKAEASTIPAAPKKITFWVKGTAAKSLSMNVETTNGRIFYNLGAFGDKDISLTPQENNQYAGAIDTKNEWRLVTIDLTGKTLKTSGDIFAIKVGSASKYDLHIDNFKID